MEENLRIIMERFSLQGLKFKHYIHVTFWKIMYQENVNLACFIYN